MYHHRLQQASTSTSSVDILAELGDLEDPATTTMEAAAGEPEVRFMMATHTPPRPRPLPASSLNR